MNSGQKADSGDSQTEADHTRLDHSLVVNKEVGDCTRLDCMKSVRLDAARKTVGNMAVERIAAARRGVVARNCMGVRTGKTFERCTAFLTETRSLS